VRVELARRCQHLECAGAAGEAREALRSAPAREDAERAAGMCENRVRRGDSRVARQGEVESTANAVAVNRCDDWHARSFNGAADALAVSRKPERLGWR